MGICMRMVSVTRIIWRSDMPCPHRRVTPTLGIAKTFSSFPRVQLYKAIVGVGNKLKVYKVLMEELGHNHRLF